MEDYEKLSLEFPELVFCPRCGCFWDREFVPTDCQECGTHITDRPGRGLEPIIEFAESVGVLLPLRLCPKCGTRYFGPPPLSGKCYRCRSPL